MTPPVVRMLAGTLRSAATDALVVVSESLEARPAGRPVESTELDRP